MRKRKNFWNKLMYDRYPKERYGLAGAWDRMVTRICQSVSFVFAAAI